MIPDADVCVVGAGAGGAVAAWALCERGLRVVLLETGPRFDPARYRTHDDEVDLVGSSFDAVTRDPARRSYTSAAGQPLDPKFRHLASSSPTGGRRPRQGTRLPFQWQRVLGVGGTTLHYQGEAHRFPAHAFRMRSERGVAADWPVDYAELAPFYERVEGLLGVAGDPDNPFKPKRGPYPYPAHPLSALSRRVQGGAAKLGLSLLPNPVAILPRTEGPRAACHYCNGCHLGCMVGAKGSVDVAVLPRARATGRLRLASDFRVTHLEHRKKDGAVTAAVGFDAAGVEQRVRAEAFVLAAGAIETPRLLLHSAGGAHPEGIGNRHDQVGRHLMETLYVLRGGIDDPKLHTASGIPLDSRIWDDNGAKTGEKHPVGFVLGQSVGPFLGSVGYALRGASGFGAAHRQAMRGRFGGGYELLAIAEQLPRPENRVTLAEQRDARGVPLALVTSQLDAGDLDVLSRAWQRLGEVAEASGLAGFTYQFSAYDTPYASHVGGTCRMGRDPRASVVDPFCRVHDVPNLVVADASVLVTQGAGDSPSLTLQALALRAAEALAERGKSASGG